MEYYQRLRDLKEDSDLTQEEVSEIIKVSTNHYGKYERWKNVSDAWSSGKAEIKWFLKPKTI